MGEQANAYKTQRAANDLAGNLSWAMKFAQKALRQSPEAARLEVEQELDLPESERVVWRVLKLPRKTLDLEHAGILPVDEMRAVLRALMTADLIDAVELSDAKALIPAEVKRIRAELQGKAIKKTEPLRARVYRPDIDGRGTQPPTSTSTSTSTSSQRLSVSAVAAAEAAADAAPPAPAGPTASSSARTAQPKNDEERALVQIIEDAFAQAKGQNHYAFLGIAREADDAAVRNAYVRLAREYHPDRIAGSSLASDDGLRAKIDTLFKRLGDAQAALATADGRNSYNRTLDALGAGPAQPEGQKQRRPAEANNAFRMAETFFKRHDYVQADYHYKQAVMFDAEDGRFHTALAWCQYVAGTGPEAARAAEAKTRLTELVTKFKLSDTTYKLGLIHRKLGDEAQAQRCFVAVTRADPSHTDAAREVRLFASRKQKTDADQKSDSSLLGRLLKR